MNWLIAHAAVTVTTILIVAAAMLILQQRRTPQSALAWLLFVMLVPYIAVPVFLMLGFRKQRSPFAPVPFAKVTDRGGKVDVNPVDNFLHCYGLPLASPGNQFELLENGTVAYERLIALIRGATREIDIVLFLFANDAVGQSVVQELVSRAKEGVRVRIVLDWLGSINRPKSGFKELTDAGGRVRLFSPFLHSPLKGHFNLRNHRKMIIVDGERLFSGGMNVAETYLGPLPSADRWHDLGFILTGPTVSDYCQVFETDWHSAGGQKTIVSDTKKTVSQSGGAIAQMAASGPDIPNDALHDAIVYGCHTSALRVWIITPYFLPSASLAEALTMAARRGIDVRILVPERSNQRTADFARSAYLRELEEVGCQILLFPNVMVHAKVVIIDGLAIVGSANMDVRSLLLNFEISLFLYSEREVAAVSDWALALLHKANKGVPPSGKIRRTFEGILRLGSPLL